jgi:hypothetical protein
MADTDNSGKLNSASFKTAMLKAELPITINEINRIVRYIERD